MSFDLKKDSGIDVKQEQHMHSLTLIWDDMDNITHRWLLWDGEKPLPHNAFKLARQK